MVLQHITGDFDHRRRCSVECAWLKTIQLLDISWEVLFLHVKDRDEQLIEWPVHPPEDRFRLIDGCQRPTGEACPAHSGLETVEFLEVIKMGHPFLDILAHERDLERLSARSSCPSADRRIDTGHERIIVLAKRLFFKDRNRLQLLE